MLTSASWTQCIHFSILLHVERLKTGYRIVYTFLSYLRYSGSLISEELFVMLTHSQTLLDMIFCDVRQWPFFHCLHLKELQNPIGSWVNITIEKHCSFSPKMFQPLSRWFMKYKREIFFKSLWAHMYTEPLQFCILYVYVNILLPFVWQYKGAEYIET